MKRICAAQVTNRREIEQLQGLAALAGQILPEARMRAHYIAHFLAKIPRLDRDSQIIVPRDLPHLLWWTSGENLSTLTLLTPDPPRLFVWTDSSNTAFGAYVDTGQTLRGIWKGQDKFRHINEKELLAAAITLNSQLIPQGETRFLSISNIVAMYCIRNFRSNRSLKLQTIAKTIFNVCKKISISVTHIAGVHNTIADAISRPLPVPTEWKLPHEEFHRLCNLVGFLWI